MQPGLHRPERYSQQLGYSFQLEIPVEAQRYDKLEVWVEARKCSRDRVSPCHGRKVVGPVELALGDERSVSNQAAPTRPEPVPAEVQDDPPEPGVEPRRIAQRAEFAPAEQDRVVDDVLRLGLIAQDYGRQSVRVVETAIAQ